MRRADISHVTKPKRCKVKECRKQFVPASPFIVWCSPECGHTLAMEKLAKLKASKLRVERRADREKKAGLKTRNDHMREAQQAFNAFIRARDIDKPCICCGNFPKSGLELHGHAWDCGHYRSTGSAPHLRFNEDNAHRQLAYCNRHGAGRAVDYRIGLIKRIGLERVEALEADQTPRKYTVQELIEIKALYRKKLRDLKEQTV